MKTATIDYHGLQGQRAADWYGLRPAKAQVCPRIVAGKRCLAYNGHSEMCVCQVHYRLLDHGRIWLDATGQHVLTGEPYDAHGDDLAALLVDLAALGLRATITAHSMWNPGSTVLILIRRLDHQSA